MSGLAVAAALLLAAAPPAERFAMSKDGAICLTEDAAAAQARIGAAFAGSLERLLADMRRGEHVRQGSAGDCDVNVRLKASAGLVELTATDGQTTYRDAGPNADAVAQRLFERLAFEPHE
jgi:hypothetical protein